MKTLIILSALALLLILVCWSEEGRARSMETQRQETARCRSLDGIPAGGKCFVNEEEE